MYGGRRVEGHGLERRLRSETVTEAKEARFLGFGLAARWSADYFRGYLRNEMKLFLSSYCWRVN
ncbi:hypothetical protein CASFOL_037096 [Castilleja foliolosa]|uniref:Uncharacterized protein n=1 Tax=Castilleja foliolosa TaxID=1961234 RepID=A0ABD3BPY1_9LAMI